MRITRWIVKITAIISILLLTGCANLIRDTAATGMVKFGDRIMSPWLLTSKDLDIMCAMGEGMGPMVFPLGPNADPMIPIVTMASATCAKSRAAEENLRYIRAMRDNRVAEAQDALTMQRRWNRVAAERGFMGYQAADRYFGGFSKTCPELETRSDKFAYFFGLIDGMMAFIADGDSGGTIGVPMSVMSQVTNGMKCLDNEEFWGVPESMDIATEVILANAGGDQQTKAEGIEALELMSDQASDKGVRLVHMVQVMLFDTMLGDDVQTKEVIRRHVESKSTVATNEEFAFIDEIATRAVRDVSDKLWTEATGQRTPYGKLGTFWDDDPEVVDDGFDLEVDDLI